MLLEPITKEELNGIVQMLEMERELVWQFGSSACCVTDPGLRVLFERFAAQHRLHGDILAGMLSGQNMGKGKPFLQGEETGRERQLLQDGVEAQNAVCRRYNQMTSLAKTPSVKLTFLSLLGEEHRIQGELQGEQESRGWLHQPMAGEEEIAALCRQIEKAERPVMGYGFRPHHRGEDNSPPDGMK